VQAWDALSKPPDIYAWQWIAYHLVEARCKDDLRRLLLDFNYLEGKLAATDPNALIADYKYLDGDIELRMKQSAIRLSAHVLTRIAGFWHNPGLPMTKTELQSALAEATQNRQKNRWNISPAALFSRAGRVDLKGAQPRCAGACIQDSTAF
jgi:APAF-1 helical domain